MNAKFLFFLMIYFSIYFSNSVLCQIGGDNTYEFVNLSSSARLLSQGNVLLNIFDDDVNLSYSLPSLNNKKMNNQFSINYTNYFADIDFGSIIYGLKSDKTENITLALKYINYGKFDETDQFGNIIGEFSAGEYLFSASTLLLRKRKYSLGSSLKLIYSNFYNVNSYGFLADFSFTYEIKKNRILYSLLMKNLGSQIKSYDKRENMPFELKMGLTSRLENAPFRISILLNHIEDWNLFYERNLDSNENSILNDYNNNSINIRNEIISHINIGSEILFSDNFNFRVGYNFRLSQELGLDLYNRGVGLSYGFLLKIKKFQFNFARVIYHAFGPVSTISLVSNLVNKN